LFGAESTPPAARCYNPSWRWVDQAPGGSRLVGGGAELSSYRPKAEISPFLVMEVLEEAERLQHEGVDVVHFEVGEPDFDTPEAVKDAARRALSEGETHYTHSLGLRALREAIAEHYQQRYGTTVSPDEILVTCGTSPALCLLFSALLDPGDEVILSNPYYACYPNFIRFAGGQPIYVGLRTAEGYQLQPSDIRAKLTSRTRAILVNSPANPTGVVLEGAILAEIAQLGPLVVSDEIYHGLVYEDVARPIAEHSVLEFADTSRVCVLNGFSKLYAMTGWRLGYVIANRNLIRAMQKLHQNFFISASSFVQRAGIAALRETAADVARMRAIYAERRAYMLSRLRQLGLPVPVEPTGAFYVLVNFQECCDALGVGSHELAFDLLHEARVAATPGVDFGTNAEGHLRFSYATSIERIGVGMDRLGQYLEAVRRGHRPLSEAARPLSGGQAR